MFYKIKNIYNKNTYLFVHFIMPCFPAWHFSFTIFATLATEYSPGNNLFADISTFFSLVGDKASEIIATPL